MSRISEMLCRAAVLVVRIPEGQALLARVARPSDALRVGGAAFQTLHPSVLASVPDCVLDDLGARRKGIGKGVPVQADGKRDRRKSRSYNIHS